MTRKENSAFLKDVVAFVDVWSTSKRENFSEGFMNQLSEMGAKVSKTLNKNVTHVIFKHGHQSTWKKAQKMGVKLVSVLWVDRCRSEGQHVDESLCPALNEDGTSVLVNKRTHKCMQPRDIPVRTPDNDKRLKRKLDKMIESLVPSSPIVSNWSPLIIDEENGIVYSPSLRRAETMAQRLKEMKEQRENLSPTASQMVESMLTHERPLKPAIGSTPSTSFMQLLEEKEEEDSPPRHAPSGGERQCVSAPHRSDSPSVSATTPSEEMNPHRRTRKLLASTPLSGGTAEGRSLSSSGGRAAPVARGGDDAPSLANQKGRSKATAKRRSAKQNSLDSYFTTALPKGVNAVMVDDAFSSDVETSRKPSGSERELKLTPPSDWSVVEDTPIRGSPTFTETRTRTNSLGSNAKQPCTSPVLPVSVSTVKSRKHYTPVSLSSCSTASSVKTKSPSAVSELKKISKSSSKYSPLHKRDDDDVFEDYFLSTDKSTRRKTFSLDLLAEKDPFSPFEQSPKPAKRRRGASESEEGSSKRRRPAPVNAAELLAESSGLASTSASAEDDPFSVTRLKRIGRRKAGAKQPGSGGRHERRRKRSAATGGLDDGPDEGGAREGEGPPPRPKAPSPVDVKHKQPKPPSPIDVKHKQPTLTKAPSPIDVKHKQPTLTKAPSPVDKKHKQLTLTLLPSPLTSGANDTRSRKGPRTLGRGGRDAVDGLRDSSVEMFSCQGGAKDRHVKGKRTLVMTSMPTEKQHTVLQVVKTLGGFSVVDTVCESTTHVVAGSPRRTLNVLLGIARGCWVLSYEWVLWCLEHRQWIPEEPYELSDHFPAAPICRLQQHLSAGEHQQDLFQGLPPMFVSPLAQPPPTSLEELIGLCGGAVCRSVRQAGILIGEYRGRKPQGARCLSERWILDCVTHLKRLPYEDYDLEYQYP